MTASKQYLYRVRPSRATMLETGPTAEEGRIIDEHFAYLQALARRGVVLLAGRTLNTDTDSFGIVIFLAGSDEEAERIMAGDPAVRAGVMSAQLFPYRIALAANIPTTGI
jgi:uncharacterized protein YciI